MTITVIGAGLAGATVAQQLAWYNIDVEVYDSRNHVGGNAHTYRDASTGVMVHAYGPHIFHTDDKRIWDYVRRFADMRPYVQRTKARAGGHVYSWPINLHTINQFYGTTFSPREAQKFIAKRAADACTPYRAGAVLDDNFTTHAVGTVGPDLYKAFFLGYTSKQWGRPSRELPSSIAKRIPIRFDYNDNAYDHKYQGIPLDGYTNMVENMLDHPRIKVRLGVECTRQDWRYATSPHVFYSGPLDQWFEYQHGALAYRTLDLETIIDLSTTDYQGCAVMNHCDLSTPFTRSTEHRHFAPWEKNHTGTIVTHEWSREWRDGDIRYYPVPMLNDEKSLKTYQQLAAEEDGVTFIGRLGTYQYLDMDKTIAASIQAVRDFLRTGA